LRIPRRRITIEIAAKGGNFNREGTMRTRTSFSLGFAACALFAAQVMTANAAPLSLDSADVAMKRRCVKPVIECANLVCAKRAGPKCCLRWTCGRVPKAPAKKH